MKILVTGASGLLGSSVVRELLDGGHDVTTLQRRPSGTTGARDILGSVTDPNAVATAIAGQGAVIHLAAKVSMAGDPLEFERVNIDGTRNVLTAAQQAGVSRFVHVSSPSVANAGNSLIGTPAEPADPASARGEYARTKGEGELLALSKDSDAFPVLVLRPHLMWGPGDTQLTERIIERARQGRMPILGSGAALVDTLYVSNAVDAIIAGLDAVTRVHGEPLVVTNGQPRPIGEFIERLALAGGARTPKLRIPVAPALAAGTAVDAFWNLREHNDEPPLTRFLAEQMSTAHWFDQRRTREVLRWEPAVSFDEGMATLARHYGQRPTIHGPTRSF
ncbi:MAG: NAD-dependent epimerase/dehydratase family protein [Leucobacter sp.]